MITVHLIQNIALLVTLSVIYRVFRARYPQDTLLYQILTGILFGGVAIIGMMTPMTLLPGVIFDGRSIILSTSGLFAGPVVAVIAALMSAVYRLILGGSGTWMGVSVIAEATALGIIFYYLRRNAKIKLALPVLWGFGFLVHIIMLSLMFALPGGLGLGVLRQMGIPILILFPISSVLFSLLFLDAENQNKNRQALLESQKALLQAQAVAHIGSWTWRIQTNQLEWSDEMYRIFGIDKNDFRGELSSVINSAIHPDDRAAVEESNRSVVEKQQPIAIEYRIIRPDGTQRVVRGEAAELMLDDHGNPAVLRGIVQDVTASRTAEKEIRESEKRYRNLIMYSPDAIFVNANGTVALVNKACLKLFGAQSADELSGKTPLELFHPGFHAQIQNRIERMIATNEPAPVAEEQIVRLDGRVVDVDVLAAPYTYRGLNNIHVILRDITERKKMEQELLSSHEMLSRLTEQVPGVVYQYRLFPDGRSCFPYASHGMQEIYEVTPEDVQEDASIVFGRIHPDDHAAIVHGISESARTLQLYHSEFRVILPRQGLRWRLCNAKPERTPDGGTLWYGIIFDITDRKLAEQKINDQLDELRRWHVVMLGREKRTIELKQEVNALLLQNGSPARYSINLLSGSAAGADPADSPAAPPDSQNGSQQG